MAANFQQMGNAGVNPMIIQQQVQQLPASGIQNILLQQIRNSVTQPLTGWHAALTDSERLGHTLQILTQLRLINPTPSDIQKQCREALSYERSSFEQAPDKETYVKAIQNKQAQLMSVRQNTAQMQAQAHAQQQQQAGMANQGGGMGQSFQQGMQHLQQQMQPSQMQAQQQPQQIPMGMGNNMMGQNIAPNAQFQMNMQQQQQQQAQMQAQQSGQPNPQAPFTPQEQQMIMNIAKQMMATTGEPQKQHIRMKLTSEMDATQAERLQRSGVDPLNLHFQKLAVQRYRQSRAQIQAGQQGGQGVSIGLNRPPGAIPMQQQRSGNPNPMLPQSQQGQQHGIPGNPDFGFLDPGQQNQNSQDGSQLGMQQSLSQQGNTTPQNMAGIPVQNVTPNQQRMAQNPQMRQQQFNQQAAAQAQARAQEQARKAQITAALQGQAGGLGGPMPLNQSPAMNTLNAPLAGTPQQNAAGQGPGNPQNGPGQFGQPIDPRFAGVQRPAVNGQLSIPTNLSVEQRQRLSQMPPERINEMMAKWNNQQSGVAGGMPGGGQMMQNPGGPQPQLGQQGMTNPMNQFMQNGQPMQRPPSQMPQGSTPQQQALFQRQLQQRMQNPGAQQPQPAGDIAGGFIDQVDFLPVVCTVIPRHVIPLSVTKWGALKQWVLASGGMAGLDVPAVMEKIAHLQRGHMQLILRNRTLQQNQQRMALGLGPLAVQQPGQLGQPGLTPQMQQQLAHMHAMQQQPITMQDIQTARAHPSGRWAGLNDDQIRQHLMTNRRNQQIQFLQRQQLQQQQQQQQMQNQQFKQQQMGQMGQIPDMPSQNTAPNGLQRPNGPPQQQGQAAPQQGTMRPQPSQGGALVSKQQPQPQTDAKQTPQARAAKPPQPTSSPAQPPPSKKRANSDDVVEVPNPNAQVNRPQMQPGPQGMLVTQRPPGPPTLSREQVAAMPEDKRQKYLQAMAMYRQRAMQAMGPQPTPTDLELFQRIREDERKKWKSAPAVNMAPEERQAAIALLLGQVQRINQVFTIAPKWFAMTKDEQRLRSFVRIHLTINDQFETGPQGQRPKAQPSMRMQDIQSAMAISSSIVQDVANKYPDMMKGRPAGPRQPQQPNAAGTSAQGQQQQPGPAPLNAANLQQQQQALSATQKEQQAKQQSQRASMNKAPPAPTTTHAPNGQMMGQGNPQAAKAQAVHHASPLNQPPFAVSSPQGIPAYNGPAKIDQGQLRLPPTKKRKAQGGAAVQPAKPVTGAQAQNQSQPIMKQELKPVTNGQAEQQQPQQQKPRGFVCADRDCEGVVPPFATRDDLEAHVNEQHVILDAIPFLMESMGDYLGLDKNGNFAGAPAMKNDASSHGNPSPQPKPKSGNDMQPPLDSWAASGVNPQELMQAFKPFETGACGAISNIDAYRCITPNDTPESTASGQGSAPNSDITENMALDIAMQFSDDANWDPFGASELDAITITETRMLEREGLPPIGQRGEGERVYNEPPKEEDGERGWDEFVSWEEPEAEFGFETGLFEMEDSNKFYGVDEGGALYETKQRR